MHSYPAFHNYDAHPVIHVRGADREAMEGIHAIAEELRKKISEVSSGRPVVLSLDLYPGVAKTVALDLAGQLHPDRIIDIECAAKSSDERKKEFADFITDDSVFGVMCHKKIETLYCSEEIEKLKASIETFRQSDDNSLLILVGMGTELVTHSDIHVFCDLCRWEIELRYRAGMGNWNLGNEKAPFLEKQKIGYFIEWRMADQYKKRYLKTLDYCIDANDDTNWKMVTGDMFLLGLKTVASVPFRMEPYFDPGVWGGKWMQHTLDVDTDKLNLAWCFDGVPEENAINIAFGETVVKFPMMDVTLSFPKELLGDRVHGRYGAEYPIRFDFLDTIEGGNLSLQVHPLTEYIQNEFGMAYTQDESYYILDVDDERAEHFVYLGLKKNIDKRAMAEDLRRASRGEIKFPVEKYVNKVPVKKHDHVLIPAGTIHCSGEGCMVLEISATPYIFTFKLWDWDRIGLDGKPRPLHVERGLENIQWERDTDYVKAELVHQEKVLENSPGCLLERTGLHDREPLEVIRYTIDHEVMVSCDDSVMQGNLVEGEEADIVCGQEEAVLTVHYAETFLVPAAVGSFKIVPKKGPVKVVLAFVRR